jgi:protein-tyrosine phosphatase
MIAGAAGRGTGTIVCTPHLYEMDDALVQRARLAYQRVAAAVEEREIPVRLLLGFEVDLAVAATVDIDTLRTLCIGTAEGSPGSLEPTTGARPAVIVEMPYSGWPPFLEQTIFRLASSGLQPVLAHPERNERVRHSPEVLLPCLNAGAIAQGTAGSLSSTFRKQCLKTFHELLDRGWFSLLASDAHYRPDYTWSLEPLLTELGKRLSSADRELLTEVNPARVIEGNAALPVAGRRAGGGGRRWPF